MMLEEPVPLMLLQDAGAIGTFIDVEGCRT